MPPTYGGAAIFGRSVSIHTTNDPSAEQINHFFGLSGTERLYGGLTGRVTLASGVLAAETPAGLAAIREQFRAFETDGLARTLVDTLGVSWSWVVLHQWRQAGDKILADRRGYYIPYRATFKHLS